MEFKTTSHKLVARICDYFEKNHLFEPGQIRTTKLVYLVECRYCAWEQKSIINLDWIFWHYGPWSSSLDNILKRDFKMAEENEQELGTFIPVHWTRPEFDEPKLKFDPTAEGILLGVLERFAAMPYNELLDYVYFETEPMRNAIKGEPLDFSTVQRPQRFVDPVSLLPPQVFNKLRQKADQLRVTEQGEDAITDPAFFELLIMLEGESSIRLPDGEVFVHDNAKLDLKSALDD